MGCTASNPQEVHSQPQMRRTISKSKLQAVDMDKFLDFCDSRHAAENVRFYKADEAYDQLFYDKANPEEILKAGEQIVVMFLSSKSPNEVTLAHSVKDGIMKAYKDSNWTLDTFRPAMSEVVMTLTDPQLLAAYEETLLRSTNKRQGSSRSYSSSTPSTPSRSRPSSSYVTRPSININFAIVNSEVDGERQECQV